MNNKQKKVIIADHFKGIMETLGLDMEDPNIADTPNRVAKMYVDEIFGGLSAKEPKTTVFPNVYGSQMVVVSGIEIASVCAHHFVPIIGKAHIGYIPGEKVLGLSKFHRIVDHYARMPQIQEQLINQIGNHLKRVLKTENLIIVIKAEHYCVKLRGVKNPCSETINSYISGLFFDKPEAKSEFFRLLEIK